MRALREQVEGVAGPQTLVVAMPTGSGKSFALEVMLTLREARRLAYPARIALAAAPAA